MCKEQEESSVASLRIKEIIKKKKQVRRENGCVETAIRFGLESPSGFTYHEKSYMKAIKKAVDSRMPIKFQSRTAGYPTRIIENSDNKCLIGLELYPNIHAEMSKLNANGIFILSPTFKSTWIRRKNHRVGEIVELRLVYTKDDMSNETSKTMD